jgi:hypothetical protein
MEFVLEYDGPLPSDSRDARAPLKQTIRSEFDAQLKHFWDTTTNRQLKMTYLNLREAVMLPNKSINPSTGGQDGFWKLLLGGFMFVPLITQRNRLKCKVEIILRKQEPPGGLIGNGGDLDNRLKTLFDALRMPRETKELAGAKPATNGALFHCLLEDDSLLTEFSVESHLLLNCPAGQGSEYARTVIKVTISGLFFS